MGTPDAKVDKILWLLEPCLTKTRHASGSMYYPTNWGFKGDAGLRDAIKRIIEEDETQQPEITNLDASKNS